MSSPPKTPPKTPPKNWKDKPTIIHDKTHQLYHEAQRRASLPQSVFKYKSPKSLLLSAPNNVIFELYNTIVVEWPNEKLVSFITKGLREYLDVHWTEKITQQVIKRLKREQALDVRAGVNDIPRIKSAVVGFKERRQSNTSGTSAGSPESPRSPTKAATSPKSPSLNETQSKSAAINQIYEHVMWRVKTDNVTQITSLLVKLVIDDGYKRARLKAELYDDVAASFEDWRSGKLIKLYAFGNAPANDQRLILASTTAGDLTKWVANFVDGSEKRSNPDLVRKLAMALRDKTKNCIYLTYDINDALKGLDTGALRCVIIVDRLNLYEDVKSLPNFSTIEPLIVGGKIYIVESLSCIDFAPDPTSEACC